MRRLAILGYSAVLWAMFVAPRAEAAHPLLGYELELIPEFSTLTVTGGFAGVHQTYLVGGVLGLSVDRNPHPPDTVQAKFGVVEAVLRGEGFFDGEDLNSVLRMTEWEGLFVDEDTVSFTGVEGQEMPITAVADLNSSRLHLTGSNTIGCCDFFDYSWDLFGLNRFTKHGHAHADFDEDGDVDGNDLLQALLNFGMADYAHHFHGDADGDGSVDRLDVTIWRYTVGRGVTPHPTAVPEPSSYRLAIMLGLLLTWCCVFRRSSYHRKPIDGT